MLSRTEKVHRSVRPTLEALEDRTVPAVTFSLVQSVLGGKGLIISGTNGNDSVTIDDNGTNAVGNVKLNGQTINANVSEILFLGKKGNDDFFYNLNGNLSAPRTVTSSLGRGNDEFTANVDGDMLATPKGNLFNNGLGINVSGEQGNDVLRVEADFVTTGGAVDIASSAFMNVSLDGGNDRDDIRVFHAGEVDGNLRVDVTGGFGDDVIQVDSTLLAGSTGKYGASGDANVVDGNSGNDILRHAVRNEGNAQVFAVLDGGFSQDVGQRTSNVTPKSLESDAVIN